MSGLQSARNDENVGARNASDASFRTQPVGFVSQRDEENRDDGQTKRARSLDYSDGWIR